MKLSSEVLVQIQRRLAGWRLQLGRPPGEVEARIVASALAVGLESGEGQWSRLSCSCLERQ